MILSDISIRYHLKMGHIVVTPEPEDRAFQPASLELRLGDRFTFINETSQPDPRTWTDLLLEPNDLVLGHTLEHIAIPDNVVAFVNGKSSLARRGLIVHTTAGFIDPGFHGEITLELLNVSKERMWLTPGEPIMQLAFILTSRHSERPYGHPDLSSHYQGQIGPVPSRWSHHERAQGDMRDVQTPQD